MGKAAAAAARVPPPGPQVGSHPSSRVPLPPVELREPHEGQHPKARSPAAAASRAPLASPEAAAAAALATRGEPGSTEIHAPRAKVAAGRAQRGYVGSTIRGGGMTDFEGKEEEEDEGSRRKRKKSAEGGRTSVRLLKNSKIAYKADPLFPATRQGDGLFFL